MSDRPDLPQIHPARRATANPSVIPRTSFVIASSRPSEIAPLPGSPVPVHYAPPAKTRCPEKHRRPPFAGINLRAKYLDTHDNGASVIDSF
jgi:hypothetical protein